MSGNDCLECADSDKREGGTPEGGICVSITLWILLCQIIHKKTWLLFFSLQGLLTVVCSAHEVVDLKWHFHSIGRTRCDQMLADYTQPPLREPVRVCLGSAVDNSV